MRPCPVGGGGGPTATPRFMADGHGCAHRVLVLRWQASREGENARPCEALRSALSDFELCECVDEVCQWSVVTVVWRGGLRCRWCRIATEMMTLGARRVWAHGGRVPRRRRCRRSAAVVP